jgi:hypothetical protein
MALAKNQDNADGKLRFPHIKRGLKMTTQFHDHLRDQRVAAEGIESRTAELTMESDRSHGSEGNFR